MRKDRKTPEELPQQGTRESKSANRLLKVLGCVSEHYDGIDIDSLAREFGVSTRTIRRDLKVLKNHGFPITEYRNDSGRKVLAIDDGSMWSSGDCDKENARPQFTYDEAAAMFMGRRFLAPLMGTFIWDAASRALEKIRSSLGPRVAAFCDRLFESVQNTRIGWSDYTDKAQILDDIWAAVEKHHCVRIEYQSLSADTPRVYDIHPYKILNHRGTYYVVGYSCRTRDIRHWKINRMISALKTDKTFKVLPNFSRNEDHYFQEMFGVYQKDHVGQKPEKVVIRFEPEVVRYVQEHIWNESQKFTPQEDNSVLMEMKLRYTVELKSWILSFGRCATVISPEPLRKMIQEEISAAAKNYPQTPKPSKTPKGTD
ncbi:MAG: transcriptional regulator [Thermoguttaceae bacterium]|nr:transcriptional regulator [Thermoguttaceae bacterium]